jgi:MFS family permease
VQWARRSISFVFFVNGFLLASWLPHIPEVKERLALNDLQLGSALLAMAAGAVLALPFAGWLTAVLGSRLATRAACLALCLFLPAPVLVPTLPALMLALLLLGAANATLDVAMNAQGVLIEDRYPRPIFASLHGLFSAGGLAGASLAGLAVSGGVAAPLHVLGFAAFITMILGAGADTCQQFVFHLRRHVVAPPGQGRRYTSAS